MRCLKHWELVKTPGSKENVFEIMALASCCHGMERTTAFHLLQIAQKGEQMSILIAEFVKFAETRFENNPLVSLSNVHFRMTFLDRGTPSRDHEEFTTRLQFPMGSYKRTQFYHQSHCKTHRIAIRLRSFIASETQLCIGTVLELYCLRDSQCSAFNVGRHSGRRQRTSNCTERAPAHAGASHSTFCRRQCFYKANLLGKISTAFCFRSRCLSIWVRLAQERCLPLEHWLEVTQLTIDRLQDSSSTVRKMALCLLKAMIEFNPFGADMDTKKYRPALEHFRKRVQAPRDSCIPQSGALYFV